MDALTTALIGLGPPGIAIAGMGFALWTLYKRNEALNDALRDITEKYATTTGANTNAINRMADLLAIRKEGGQ
jgi:hypothetical protein